MQGAWPWLPLIGLGLFHGLNPAMGWLFAVALGLHRRSRIVVYQALVPIALGHAAAVLVVVLAITAFGRFVDPTWLDRAAGLVLIGWALWHVRYGHRHRVRFGMQTGMAGLAAWSFLMASAHGAGLMLIPFVAPTAVAAHEHHQHLAASAGWDMALLAVLVHSLAMLAATAACAVFVYEWLGVAILRRGWVNLDRLWIAALFTAGLLLLF